jgi:hypothetical protein
MRGKTSKTGKTGKTNVGKDQAGGIEGEREQEA